MDRKDKELPEDLGDAYKDLPLPMRVKVNITASKLLDLQKENNSFLTNAGDRPLEDESER
jgi:hypothetical protein